MKHLLVLAAAVAAASLVVGGCAPSAPPLAPTKSPATPTGPAEPTKAAAAPTKAASAQPATTPVRKVDFPEKGKAITVIVPWAAGAATDIGARLVVGPMEKELGVPIQIVNKPGASSQVGITDLVRSKPDGYTIAWTNLPSSMSPYLDPSRGTAYGRKDLAQVANVVFDPEVLAVNADSKYRTLKDLLDAARANPEQVKVGFAGIGADSHLALLLIQEAAGVKFNPVNFDSGAPAITALQGGHIDGNTLTLGNYATPVKSGVVRLLALMDKQRSRLAPDVPTFEELGYRIAYASSRGISAPAGTPREIIDLLSRVVKNAMEDPAVRNRFDEMWLTTRYLDAAQYTAYWDDFEKQTKPLLDKVLITK